MVYHVSLQPIFCMQEWKLKYCLGILLQASVDYYSFTSVTPCIFSYKDRKTFVVMAVSAVATLIFFFFYFAVYITSLSGILPARSSVKFHNKLQHDMEL